MLEKIRQQILAGAKEYFLLCLFLTLVLFEALLWPPDFELGRVGHVIIGIATFHNVDVSARVRFFYVSLIFLAFVFSIFCGLFGFCGKRSSSIRKYSHILAGLSFLGLSMLVFELFGFPSEEGLHFVFASMGGLLFLFFVRLVRRKAEIDLNHERLLFIGLTALSISIGLGKIFSLFNVRYLSLNLSYFITACFLICFLYSGVLKMTDRLVYRCLPVYFLPLLFVFSVELFFILNQHRVYLGPPILFFLLGLALLSLFFWLRSRRKTFRPRPLESQLCYFSVPVVLAGIVAVLFYAPVQPLPTGLFEEANAANAVMRWFEWGEIPFVEHLSSHFLWDYALPYFYVLLNGYTGQHDFRIYTFLLFVIGALASYYFLLQVFRNWYVPVFLILFFPFFNVLFPIIFVFSIFTIFLIYRLFMDYSFMRLFALFSWCAFLLIWRIDTGVANIAAAAVLLGIYAFRNERRGIVVDSLKAGAILIVLPVIVYACLAFWKGVNPLHPLRLAVDYLGANQAHGFAAVAKAYHRHFLYQYIVFPVLLLGVLLLLLFRFNDYFKKEAFWTISMVFLLIFYFTNAQRGFVRHSMFANKDMYLSSFLLLILPLSSLALLNREKRFASAGFIVLAFLLVQNFKYPSPDGTKSYYQRLGLHLNTSRGFTPSKKKINRVSAGQDFPRKTYQDFKRFMDENFGPEATFIDFSYAPMLYFYTKRRVPSYFNQYMQNTVTEFLQEKNIERLKRMDVPVVVFANHPKNMWDRMNQVPNTLRHQMIAQFIFDHYMPFSILNARQIWIRKGVRVPGKWATEGIENIARAPENYALLKLPAVLGRSGSLRDATVLKSSPGKSKNIRMDLVCEGRQPDQFLELVFSRLAEDHACSVTYGNDENHLGAFSFDVLASERPARYLVPMSPQYNWYTASGPIHIKIESSAAPSIRRVALLQD